MDAYLNNDDEMIRVQEVGPIVYSYKPNITILNWTNNENEVTFARFKTYHFEPEMTKISLDTPINTINMVAASVVDNVNSQGYFKR
jgi:hypothetical protein